MAKLRNAGLIAAALCIAVFCGCAGDNRGVTRSSGGEGAGGNMDEPGTFEGLSAETERRILEDYAEYRNANIDSGSGSKEITADDIYIEKYCGTYNGYVVVIQGFSGPSAGVVITYEYRIAGIRFYGSPEFIIWNNGLFNGGLQEAYDMGLLTRDDLKSIAGYFGGYREHELGTFDGLSAETERLILEDYAEYCNANIDSGSGSKEITADDIYIGKYCGAYNGYIVVVLDNPGLSPVIVSREVLYEYRIAGIRFLGPSPFLIWNNGLFNGGLQEAYESGLLTRDDLKSIVGYFGGYVEG